MKNAAITYMDSPLGKIKIIGDTSGIKMITFVDKLQDHDSGIIPQEVKKCQQQLTEYFKGQRKTFDVKLAPEGTDFQKEVWQELMDIPYGKTSTYAKQAVKLGDIKKIRAVGAANGKNPISIIIPCHRVIGSDGNLTGYAGGLERKAWLLKHEKSLPGMNQTTLF